MTADWIRQISQLQATLGKMELALGSVLEAIVLTDEAGRIQWCNAAFDRLARKSRLEILGAEAAELLPLSRNGRKIPPAKHPLRLVLKSGAPVAGAFELLRGSQKKVLEISGAAYGADEEKHAILAVRDVTERATAREALESLRSRYELILNSAGEGIYGLDARGCVTFANPAAAKTLGYDVEELMGRPMHALTRHSKPDGTPYPPEECPICATLQDKASRSAQDEVFWRKDGASLPVEYSSTPILENGAVTGAVVVFKNLTERRRLEAQFLQSQKMEAVGRLAGGMAHDFNNLLTAILGFGHMVHETLESKDPRRKDVEEILKAARQAGALTHQLMALSRRQAAAPRILDINSRIRSMEKMLRRLIGEDVEIKTILKSSLGRTKADPAQMDQAILNLAVNARDAMPKGGRLTIETANMELDPAAPRPHIDARPGPYVMVSVSDTGTGMDEETRAHLFEPFFTTKKAGKGTGLGLSTVYGIVKQNRGFILVHSELNRGSAFKLYLPRVRGAAARAGAGPKTSRRRGRQTILLVEDERAILKMARRVLEGNGYSVLEAGGAEKALEFCGRHPGPIHLLLTDVIMPKMSGRELASRLKKLRPETKLLFMSGYTEARLPLPRLLPKPFTPESLLRKVREVLDHG